MDVNRILNVLSLYKSPKVYLWSLLASIALFFLYWGAKHPYAAGDNTMTALSLAVVFVGGILFVACYTFGNRQLALAFAEKEFQTEPASMMDAVQQGKGYLLSIAALLACFLVLTLLAVPALGTIVGGFFIVTVAEHDFNILTLFINFFLVYAWLFIGTSEIVLADVKFKDTAAETVGFIFDNFAKMFAYAFALFLILTVFEFIVVSLLPLSRLVALPILVALFAYALGLINTMTMAFVATNLDMGERDEDGEATDEEDDDSSVETEK